MGLGQRYVAEMRRIFDIPHTKLHPEHMHCRICQTGPFSTIEEMLDHVARHPERVNCRVTQKDDAWIVLVEANEYYTKRRGKKSKKEAFPPALVGLPTIKEQERQLGVEAYRGKVEYVGPKK